MNEDKPDRFGKYRDKIVRMHNKICTKICDDFSLENALVEMPVHQMSIFEYINEKHDEDYSYFLYAFNEKLSANKSPDFFISVNNKYLNELFNNEYFKVNMLKTISKLWNISDKNHIINYSVTRNLEIQNNDVIQSIHFFYKNEQLFKIIYFYESFRAILEE